MAKNYEKGDKYFLPVVVDEIIYGDKYPVKLTFLDGGGGDSVGITDEPNLLLTATEIAENIAGRRCAECYPTYDEVKARNEELEALLKEVMATRDEAIRQNDELITKNNELEDANCNLTKACSEWQIAAQTCADNAKVADKATEELRKENKDLKAKAAENADAISRLSANKVALTEEVGRLRETIADRTIDVQHIAEENAQLQNKVSEFQNRVGEQLAQIQDLNAEVHFHKEFGEGLDKQQKELQARYDELDSVNKEQAEKIRKLDKALTDLKKRNDDLQAENTNLTFLLEDAPENETTKTLHVVLNDGTEIEFRRYTAYDYRTDIKMFVVKDGERFIAGFNRGDKSFNFAYWWTE